MFTRRRQPREPLAHRFLAAALDDVLGEVRKQVPYRPSSRRPALPSQTRLSYPDAIDTTAVDAESQRG